MLEIINKRVFITLPIEDRHHYKHLHKFSRLIKNNARTKTDGLVLKRLRENRFIRNMHCKQCASSFDKSKLLVSKAFLLKSPSKIIFANRIFLLIDQFFEGLVFCILPKTRILILLARRRQSGPKNMGPHNCALLTSDDLMFILLLSQSDKFGILSTEDVDKFWDKSC